MKIDLKAVYLMLTVVAIMGILAIATVKKLVNTRSKFTTFLMYVEEIIGAGTLGYLLALGYKAMENYEAFYEKYGSIIDYFTYISIYFCASQIFLLLLVKIYKIFNRHSRLIKKRRIIK